MKKFAVYDLAIKILSLYFVIQFITITYSIISYLFNTIVISTQMDDTGDFVSMNLIVIIENIIYLVIYALIIREGLFHTKRWVKKILPAEEQDETVQLGMDAFALMQLACIISGFLLVGFNLTGSLTAIREWLQSQASHREYLPQDGPQLSQFAPLVSVITGVAFLVWSAPISKILTARIHQEQKSENQV